QARIHRVDYRSQARGNSSEAHRHRGGMDRRRQAAELEISDNKEKGRVNRGCQSARALCHSARSACSIAARISAITPLPPTAYVSAMAATEHARYMPRLHVSGPLRSTCCIFAGKVPQAIDI